MTCLFINYVTYFQHAFNVIFSLNSSVRIWFSCRVLKLLPSFLYQNSFRLVILIINILILTFNVLSNEFKLFPPSCRIIFSITDSNSNVLILKLSQNLLCQLHIVFISALPFHTFVLFIEVILLLLLNRYSKDTNSFASSMFDYKFIKLSRIFPCSAIVCKYEVTLTFTEVTEC